MDFTRRDGGHDDVQEATDKSLEYVVTITPNKAASGRYSLTPRLLDPGWRNSLVQLSVNRKLRLASRNETATQPPRTASSGPSSVIEDPSSMIPRMAFMSGVSGK